MTIATIWFYGILATAPALCYYGWVTVHPENPLWVKYVFGILFGVVLAGVWPITFLVFLQHAALRRLRGDPRE